MDDLIQEFIAETREMLDALGGEIVAWEAAPSDRARLDEIFRFVHTVKGNCGFFDLGRLEALSHAAENVLADVRGGKRTADRGLVNAVLAVIDRIGELVQSIDSGEEIAAPDDDDLIAALDASTIAVKLGLEDASLGFVERKSLRSIRLSVDLLDRMMNGVSDMVLARNELARSLREIPGDVAVASAFDRVSGCIAEMRDTITRTRMQRIDNLFVTLPRLVRDLSAGLEREVTLEIEGGDVELDREMIEMIRDPLTHIVRNAIDHGIESPEDRVKAGKSPNGTIRVSARQSGNQILIEMSDNGRGIDGDRLAKKAIGIGLITSEQSERLTPNQKSALIFEPGLSTAAEVTQISGRGVGMDVVRANVERIGGVVDLESRPGEGVRLTLRVPLTLTIIPALLVSVAGQCHAIPRMAIEEIVRCKGSAVRIETVGGARIATIRDKRVPLVSLADVLGVEERHDLNEQNLILLKPAAGDVYALAVDLVHDHEELVVKPAAPAVMATGLYAGTTLGDNGSPILLLDPSGIAANAGLELDQGDFEKRTLKTIDPNPPREQIPALLFKGLDGGKRVIRLAVVERIEDVPADAIRLSAGRLRVARGDNILPLMGCDDYVPAGGLRILRLSDGVSELAYGFAEVVDLVALSDDVLPATSLGEISGVTLIGGEQVEIVDPYWLFAALADGAMPESARPVCALPAGDPWMENILRPIIESAGYRVVPADRVMADEVDVLIASADDDVIDPSIASADILRIRSSIEREHDADDSIYRYDRAGLLGALGMRAAARRKG